MTAPVAASPEDAAQVLAELLRPVDPDRLTVRWYRRFGKRTLDLVAGSLLAAMLAPVFAAVAVAVRLRLGRPILFHQVRLTVDGTPFVMHKFRTMQPDRRREEGPFEGPDRRGPLPSLSDPRLTGLGMLLSRTSLDELPQLFNVITGQMSLVGPRPDYPHRLSLYAIDERSRFDVPPGITGPWQVLVGTTNDLHEYVGLDRMYVDRCSFTNDLRLLAATPAAALRRLTHSGWEQPG